MLMRRYLRDCWLDGIEQEEFERIVTLFLEQNRFPVCRGTLRDGNIILTNGDNVIVQCRIQAYAGLRHKRSEVLVFRLQGKTPSKLPCLNSKRPKSCYASEVVRALAKFLVPVELTLKSCY
jgi:hypothetical protein